VCYSAPQTKKHINELTTRKEKREKITNEMSKREGERGVKK